MNNSQPPSIRLGPTHPPAPPAQAATGSQNQVERYRQAHIETATPERLIVMLYDGAVKYLNFALQTLNQDDREGVHLNLLKAQAIILELMAVLDMDLGGELAVNLHNLYDYMYRQLVQANLEQQPQKIEEVLKLLAPLRSAWDEAADMVTQMRAEGKLESTPGLPERHFAG